MVRSVVVFNRGLTIVPALLLGGVLATGAPTPAAADGLFDGVLETLNLKTKVGPTPGFVEATHPDPSSLRFIPTGTPRAKPEFKMKSPAEIESAKAALDAARDAQLQPRPGPGVPLALGPTRVIPKATAKTQIKTRPATAAD